jgi:hypothetical protein
MDRLLEIENKYIGMGFLLSKIRTISFMDKDLENLVDEALQDCADCFPDRISVNTLFSGGISLNLKTPPKKPPRFNQTRVDSSGSIFECNNCGEEVYCYNGTFPDEEHTCSLEYTITSEHINDR